MPAIVKPRSISWTEIFRRAWKAANQDDVLGRSAQLAYYFFLALFPLLICVVTVLGVLAGKDAHVQDAVLNFLASVLPGSASMLIQKTLTEVDQAHATSKLSIGLVFSLWSASAGMSAIMDTLNAEYQVHESRSFIKRNAVALGLTLAVAILLIAAVAIVLAGGPTAEAFSGGMVKLAIKILQWPVAIALVLFGFALVYFFAPDVKEQKWHWITPGAIAGVAMWLAASFVLKIYLHFFDSYSATYGSLGAVIILLLWFYVSGASLLFGAEINSVIEDAAAAEGEPDAKLKGEKAPQEPDHQTKVENQASRASA
ncbi:MAG: rane protein [Acidobacteriaceae bacterium]|jgi:membrane protein|nr:rane protein [Acidobacteriaceae bacterium]